MENNITLEEKYFLDNRLVQPRKIPERRDDALNGRWYQYGNEFKPSMTTILNVISKGIGYMKWLANSISWEEAMRYSKERADSGSRTHTDIAHLILGGEFKTIGREEEEIKRVQEFVQFWQQYKPFPVTVECPVWVDDIPFSGTVDFIGKIKNKKGKEEIWLIDWKTGEIWSDYKYQISGYKYLVEKAFNLKINKCALIQLKGSHRGTCTVNDKPKYKIVPIEPLPYQTIINIYELWFREEREPQPKFPSEYPEIIKL